MAGSRFPRMVRRCASCGVEKKIGEFPVNHKKATGRSGVCTGCTGAA